ncbi:MAG: MraY family glycosyltransferase [bacterium]
MHWQALIWNFCWFVMAAAVAVGVTFLVRQAAYLFGVLDDPARAPRKQHKTPVPLLGGIGIIIATIIIVAVGYVLNPHLFTDSLSTHNLLLLLAAAIIIGIGGLLDDCFDLKPRYQIIFPIAAVTIVVAGGIGIREITNPFGGILRIQLWPVLTFIWLLSMSYTTKLLDGVDGLATGVTGIGAIMVLLLALSTAYYQSDVAFLSALFAGVLAGFLVWNFSPAQIYLGESGSVFIGFFLGILAIISGGKIATALLVMGIPLFDVAAVMVQRVRERRSPISSDRKHLHFRLQQAGLSVRQTVLVMYLLSASFGLCTLFLQSRMKLVALGMLAILMVLLLIWSGRKYNPQTYVQE